MDEVLVDAAVLATAIRFLDAFGESLAGLDEDDQQRVVTACDPILRDLIDLRCAVAGDGDASGSAPAAFVSEAADYSLEIAAALAKALRDQLGIEAFPPTE